jgi:hypothetical protein
MTLYQGRTVVLMSPMVEAIVGTCTNEPAYCAVPGPHIELIKAT